MEFLESLNQYLMTHPVMQDELELLFRVKHWILLGLAVYFILLPYREHKKEISRQAELAKMSGHFLA